jgi:hypothetical protein
MHEQELDKIIQALREMEGRFEEPTTAAAPHLNSADRATFKRLMLEAKSILDSGLGLNDFGVPLLMMTNLPSYGAFNPPTLSQLHEAVGLVEGGLNQLRRKNSRSTAPLGTAAKPTYVDPTRILELQGIKSAQWDLKRLVRLLQEINAAHANEMHMATAMLVRAVTDHVPPIFNARNFAVVANSYPAPRSFSDQMKYLDNSLRKVADTHLHLQVRKAEVLPNAAQVDFRAALDVLLSEVVRLLH